MAAQRGKDILLKLVDPADQSTTTVAGLRTKRIAFNAETVDITDADSVGRWRELLSGAGMRRAAISAAGIFKDKTSDEKLRAIFFDGTIESWQMVIPDFGTITGQFQITALEYGGSHNEEVTFDIALESASSLVFEVMV